MALNLLGSSGKGHEYFLKYLLGTTHGVQGKDLGEEGGEKPLEVKWRPGAEGKLDLLVTLDFRMSTTCMYSDIVLPTTGLGMRRMISIPVICIRFIHPLWQQWIRHGKRVLTGIFLKRCPDILGGLCRSSGNQAGCYCLANLA